ncbi:phytanoyl-CoA dioxygenase family protein [Polaribacter sp. R2A056_3_33]|jgi:ectoine hydroxylase-related dioxygenase (phytanoyl-CoA dioxygenase family)|uniref:phytanoyl-CoA dioxygenase family protein n=1 Tax=Polaribacter sp. R2A056_3_33 TaxID=2745563 RepID=UPI001C4EB6D9|nr:phytanoyl-CoA dioxygenase family protein [Polaribacter sp. R2A056_3_33]QXP70738.1 phytanoyl-CoA dioxygenase family protein [Polaribacter sp. R2A056_3_33]
MISVNDLKLYKENGYLVIRNFLSTQKIEKLNTNYDNLRKKLAKQSFIKYSDYQKEISQIRDIWKYDKEYEQLILEGEIAEIAPLFFKEASCRLLHDHVINKPLKNNGTVPWHQDYTYWPTDNPNGLSIWLPFNDLDKDAGVLEIIPKSHLWGEEKPIDFINDTKFFSADVIKHLTVKKGDLVILDALTWHKTSENISIKERKAYISLWIPTNSRYTPKHASWHPVNDNITVKENEVLNNDWFPVIGKEVINNQNHIYMDNSSTESMSKITMFNASKIAKNFLQRHLNLKKDIWTYLYIDQNRYKAIDILIARFKLNKNSINELNEVLLSMAINGIAYQNHRGRNVYNKSYLKFKKIFKNEI